MIVASLIEKKRDGARLEAAEIRELIAGYLCQQVSDAQMAALAMAVFFRDMDAAETSALTRAIVHSGRVLSWPRDNRPPIVDKHSTGGVGDKITLPLAPVLAELGMWVPMISGRGLGPTGGTLDKLESIPGFRTNLSVAEIDRLVREQGVVITGASEELAPADRQLYALRDVTGTVPVPALITSSILGKKLAAGLEALVLDVKWGSGAMMRSRDAARDLATRLVSTARELGLPTTALLTDMNQPLGRWIGNAAEVNESLEVLEGAGPADVRELVVAQAVELLLLTGMEQTREPAQRRVETVLDSGRARERFMRMVAGQGGKLKGPLDLHPGQMWVAERDGVVQITDCRALGYALIAMRGGRVQQGDELDRRSALEMLVRHGDAVQRGQPLVRVYYDQPIQGALRQHLTEAIQVSDEATPLGALIVERIGMAG